MIYVEESRCPRDRTCPMLLHCPSGAISQKGFNAPRVDNSKCEECFYCVNNCPHGAFRKL